MKKLFLLLALGPLIFSCSSSRKTAEVSTNVNEINTSYVASSGEGSSYETAIVIQEKTEWKGVDAEYNWLDRNYRGYKLQSQRLSHRNNLL